MLVQVANASLFPEIDFASKCVEPIGDWNDIGNLLGPLSDSDTRTIQKRLSGKSFFVHHGPGRVSVELTRSKDCTSEDDEA